MMRRFMVNRRQWLKQLMTGGTAAYLLKSSILPSAAISQHSWNSAEGGELALPAKLQTGFSLYGVTDQPLTTALQQIAETGYGGIELPLLPGGLFDPLKLSAVDCQVIRSQIEAESLDLQAVMENLPLLNQNLSAAEDEQRLKRAFDVSRKVSPETQPLLETILGGKPGDWPRLKNFAIDQLGRWTEIAKSEDAVIAIKPHIANALQRPDEIAGVFNEIRSPHLRLAFDYSHLERQRIPIDMAVKTLARYSVFVHVKDNVQVGNGWQFALPGQGITDYGTLFVSLKEAGYRGPICVEVSSQVFSKPGFSSKEAITTTWAALRPAFEKAGIIAVA